VKGGLVAPRFVAKRCNDVEAQTSTSSRHALVCVAGEGTLCARRNSTASVTRDASRRGKTAEDENPTMPKNTRRRFLTSAVPALAVAAPATARAQPAQPPQKRAYRQITPTSKTVNGQPLEPGRYLVTLRAVEGSVARELGHPRLFVVPGQPE